MINQFSDRHEINYTRQKEKSVETPKLLHLLILAI